MGPLFALLSLLLLIFQLLLIGRAILDWSTVLAGPSARDSLRSRATVALHTLTEPVLAPVRRVLPPVRVGGAAIDLSFIVVFVAIVIIRAVLP
ncbi:YggT family protein [Solwaraspora sp. WMMD791]|uniref:YggT family protein n=1 Tax=unclassified Solwaraspora TaxID=2627926 RepID=UPI002499EE81|nr:MULTISPECIES: YggT family protein [unclassified Solwaraspora]WFE27425.1 YggT family protein [Solwaraspora sp. WMMD791]WJK39913.1 YggT family protein [Solwaraspora sp. WMMA2056]